MRSNASPQPLPASRPAPFTPSRSTELPMLSSGKPDYQAVRDLARASTTGEPQRDRPARAVRRCAADRRRWHRSRRQLRRPRRQFAVLRDDVGPAGTRAGPAARRLAAAAAAASWKRMPKPARRWWPWLGRDAGDQRRAARRRDRAHRRIARRVVRAVGRRAPAARHRGIQLRPVLPHAGAAHRPGAAPAQHHRVDRGAVGGVDRDRADDHRRLSRRQICCWPTSSSARTTA